MLQPPACMSMKTHDDAPEVVMDAPGDVPKNNELKGRQFFVRKCYPEYYKLVSTRTVATSDVTN